VLAVVAGLVTGAAIFGVVAVVARHFVPEIAYGAGRWTVPGTVLVALLLGAVSAWLPLRRLRSVYPGEVFRP